MLQSLIEYMRDASKCDAEREKKMEKAKERFAAQYDALDRIEEHPIGRATAHGCIADPRD